MRLNVIEVLYLPVQHILTGKNDILLGTGALGPHRGSRFVCLLLTNNKLLRTNDHLCAIMLCLKHETLGPRNTLARMRSNVLLQLGVGLTRPLHREGCCRGTSLMRNIQPHRTTIGPQA